MRPQLITLRRVWLAIGVGLILVVIWLSLTPHPIKTPLAHGDKFGHLAAYGTLMVWFAQLDARLRTRIGYAVGFIALGIALEFAQGFTDYRVSEVADMVANATGVLLGWLIAPPRGPHVLGFMQRMRSGPGI